MSEPAPGVFFVEGPASNWIIVRDDSGFILIDSGYPADAPLVLDSIRSLDLRPEDAKAILITHGHVDHTGSAAQFSRLYGTPVLCSPEELAHVQGHEKHQVTLATVISRSWNPRVLKWMIHAISAGALRAEPVPSAEPWTAEMLHNLPGRPRAVSVPGHTAGSAVLVFPEAGAIATGDALVTGHALSPFTGAQMLDPMFHSDPAGTVPALDALDGIDASVILPGHGPAASMPISDAVAAVRR
ncbi:MBL fold metallo-hydrolase [Pseudarthrobacter sp. BIM B-2242]|uniref:MBL fold metallo-hydrolase n=1 Tax=Pseudarthrobacter sp. BIM B-2242 TaxID=2772401 RepID=UPI00168B6AD5|nr:MBL fold metallo-hydrolase [Pseudarthrobacter sp. BIM B-2242]QOD05929.1 MBL fold metallo-hydrolase [Pseudarthrobacter sp. BIM B-2242]